MDNLTEFLNNGKAHLKAEMNADDLMAFSEKALLIYRKLKWIIRVCRIRFGIGGREDIDRALII